MTGKVIDMKTYSIACTHTESAIVQSVEQRLSGVELHAITQQLASQLAADIIKDIEKSGHIETRFDAFAGMYRTRLSVCIAYTPVGSGVGCVEFEV